MDELQIATTDLYAELAQLERRKLFGEPVDERRFEELCSLRAAEQQMHDVKLDLIEQKTARSERK